MSYYMRRKISIVFFLNIEDKSQINQDLKIPKNQFQ